MLLLNDDDLTYCKLRLDEHSLATLRSGIAGFEPSLPRALGWSAAWDMTRDGELAARDYVALVVAGPRAETDIGVTADPAPGATALEILRRPGVGADRLGRLACTAKAGLTAAAPGSGFSSPGPGRTPPRPARTRTWRCCAAGWTASR